MRKNAFFILFTATVAACLLAGCAPPISREVRVQATEKLPFTKVLASPASYQGVVVIWGGVIMKTVNYPDHSDIYLWETPEDLRGRPEDRGEAEGAFIARTSESLDPNIYVEGRKVTVAGEVAGQALGTYHEQPYAYPVIKVREIHLWPPEKPVKWDWGNVPSYSPYQYTPRPFRPYPPP